MRIFLDTCDLINLFEKNIPCDSTHFREKMSHGGHQLVLSFATVVEIAAPLLQRATDTNVMRLLNLIESVPLSFIKANLIQLELVEAIRAYTSGTEYRSIYPFASHFDDILVSPPAKGYATRMSLSEFVFTIWSHAPDVFKGFHRYHLQMIRVLDEDRAERIPPDLRDHFVVVVARNLKMCKLNIPHGALQTFAHWIYDSPARCPGLRLGYEVYHKLRHNLGDKAKKQDIADFSHVDYVPYIDMITLDRRMKTYARQAGAALGVDYGRSIYNNVVALLSDL